MLTKEVDVVIPVKDEAFKLQFCCKSVLENITVNNLIIVVSSSKDNTLEIARKYGDIVIRDEDKGVGHARAVGLEKVETEYYASLDADVIVPRNWYSLCMKTIEKPLVGACQGRDWPVGRNYAKWKSLPYIRDKHCSLGNTLLRTRVVREVGMPTVPFMEDHILRDRLKSRGYNWIIRSDLVVMHWVNDIDILRHYMRYGSQQRIKLRKILNWTLFSLKDFMNPKSNSKHRDFNLSIFMLLARLARCFGALQAFTPSDVVYDNLPFW